MTVGGIRVNILNGNVKLGLEELHLVGEFLENCICIILYRGRHKYPSTFLFKKLSVANTVNALFFSRTISGACASNLCFSYKSGMTRFWDGKLPHSFTCASLKPSSFGC